MPNDRNLIAPFTGQPPTEVPLPRAPLVRVIAQIRFPAVLSISKEEFIAPFQESIRAEYPRLGREEIHRIIATANGQPDVDRETVWRFVDATENWRASLAKDFISLECRTYSSRHDFIARLATLAKAASGLIGATTTNRIGIRYISQIKSPEYERLQELLALDILGAVGRNSFKNASNAMITAGTADIAEGKANYRWGFLSNGTTIDPEVLEPVNEASWIFDIDAATTDRKDLTEEAAREAANALAERCYTIFRSLVTDDFLRAYGGDI